jgi:S-adenosylmethionine synthetase
MRTQLVTAESVSEGHPDKIADQISDAVLDAFLDEDALAHVSCQSFVTHGLIVVAGEFRTSEAVFRRIEAAAPDIVRDTLRRIGYRSAAEDPDTGCDPDAAEIRISFNRQSPDIDQGVSRGGGVIGAGDQGVMFGFACDETPQLMPLAAALAHALVRRQAEARKAEALGWLRPDAKSQVTVRYLNGKPDAIDTVVLSTQHEPDIDHKRLSEGVIEEIIKPVLPKHMMKGEVNYLVNPTGRFVVGGPHGDCGLTGRKIIVDTYGGAAPHGGGAFSGKDPSKVDRSAAYAARYVAKNVVAAGLASKCLVQVAYAIGVARPVSVMVTTYGTGKMSDEALSKLVAVNFDLRPKAIIQTLNLLRPIYRKTAAYGHFGREEPEFTWEATDKALALKAAA